MASTHLLFETSLISTELQATLPANIKLRPLGEDDYEKGFLDTLSHLTSVGNDNTKGKWLGTFLFSFDYMHERLKPDDCRAIQLPQKAQL